MEKVKTELFADGTGKISYLGSMFRIELKTLDLSEEERQPGVRVIMPAQGFFRMFRAMEQAVGKLREISGKNNATQEKPLEKTKKTASKSVKKTVDKQHKQPIKQTKAKNSLKK